jgi:hypothetical protein
VVVVVAAVSKASSGRAWQSSSSYLYIYSILLKRIRYRVFFWCVFGELFLARDFFFSLFFVLFSSKTQQTRSILDRHTLQNNARPKLCVCVCACLWCDCRLKGTI